MKKIILIHKNLFCRQEEKQQKIIVYSHRKYTVVEKEMVMGSPQIAICDRTIKYVSDK